jgi:hypothetical protein
MAVRKGPELPLPKRLARDRTAMADAIELYCAEHPRSPSAVRKPQLYVRGKIFVALLGASIQNGIAGFGDNVTGALRAFDVQYQRALRPPAELKRTSKIRAAIYTGDSPAVIRFGRILCE